MRLSAMFVYLSVRLLARLLKNARIDLDEMLHVDRCRDMEGRYAMQIILVKLFSYLINRINHGLVRR